MIARSIMKVLLHEVTLMPFIYKLSQGGREPYTLPSFFIDTDTMELFAVQSDNDPITFYISDDSELQTEV